MGIGSSRFQYNDYNNTESFSEDQIRQRINKLFVDNKHNPISDYSFAFPQSINDVPSPSLSYQSGGFKQTRNRYDNILLSLNKQFNNISGGGNMSPTSDYNELSNLSEFDRIRNYMLSQIDANQPSTQAGGTLTNTSEPFFEPLSSTPVTEQIPRLNFFDLIRGGTRSHSKDYDFSNSNSSNSSNSSNFSNYHNFSFSDSNSNHNNFDDFNNEHSDIYSFSDTSAENKASGIGIMPFYSSESSTDYSFQHPYAKSRF